MKRGYELASDDEMFASDELRRGKFRVACFSGGDWLLGDLFPPRAAGESGGLLRRLMKRWMGQCNHLQR